MKTTNCFGCKYLFGRGHGYSDYTWMETYIECAKELNEHLPIEMCVGFMDDEAPSLRLLAVVAQECDQYEPGPFITVSPDGNPDDSFIDADQFKAFFTYYNGQEELDNLDDEDIAWGTVNNITSAWDIANAKKQKRQT